MNLPKLQQLLLDSLSEDDSKANAADKQIAQLTAQDPKLAISLHLQNLTSKPLHQSVSGSILELKNLANRAVFDISKIGDAEFQTYLKKSLLDSLSRTDFDQSDLDVLASLVPNVASRYVFKGEWNDYASSLLSICKNGKVGGLITLKDSLNSKLIKYETYQDEINSILTNSFSNPKTQLYALTILFAAVSHSEFVEKLQGFGKSVVQLLKVCPTSDLNLVMSALSAFVEHHKDFFNPVKPELRDALLAISTKQGVLARVKRLATALVDSLK